MRQVDENNPKGIRGFWRRHKETILMVFFRWWLASAVYFFVGWGTELALYNSIIDMIFILGIVVGIVQIVIFNPVVYGMFNVKRRGKIVNKEYYNRTVFEGVWLKVAEIFKCMFVMLLVFLTYQGINTFYIMIYHVSDTFVALPGEPVLFGLFFLIYYSMLSGITDKIVSIAENDSTNNKKEGQ